MDFSLSVQRALEIREKYDALNERENQLAWAVNDYAQALGGDVGDLLKLLMMKKGLRKSVDGLDAKIEHELADCLWALCVIADKLGIDLEKSFFNTMNELDKRLP